ncbi:hypothetical protein SAMN02745148_00539 [Modicisalibacter ilicicola DSM 19980]|uniref:Uncharacterized protein n=1 Tax=Modicisalibacter ilicicola DSM 19980 TaxID=1121942 RepID=A0A1M4U8F0_9GAMM|nr:hypothetical protein [Halomonas ilicicola]SHE52877.1 hypothetical protein SAMN02745148_00539 [Halomonas ilicicola DSM 19980]
MFDWLSRHSDLLTIFTNTASIIVWLGFSQALYMEMRRRRHPRLLINSGKKKDTSALCIISNMSDEPVFIEYIIAELDTSRGVIRMDVTDYDQSYTPGDEDQGYAAGADRREPADLDPNNDHQGPLDVDDFIHIGTFDRVIRRLAREAGIEMEGHRPAGDLHFRSLTIRLIGIYGPESLPIGAERRFKLTHKYHYCALRPASADTRRLASRWQRHKVRKWIEQINASSASARLSFRRLNGEDDNARL